MISSSLARAINMKENDIASHYHLATHFYDRNYDILFPWTKIDMVEKYNWLLSPFSSKRRPSRRRGGGSLNHGPSFCSMAPKVIDKQTVGRFIFVERRGRIVALRVPGVQSSLSSTPSGGESLRRRPVPVRRVRVHGESSQESRCPPFPVERVRIHGSMVRVLGPWMEHRVKSMMEVMEGRISQTSTARVVAIARPAIAMSAT